MKNQTHLPTTSGLSDCKRYSRPDSACSKRKEKATRQSKLGPTAFGLIVVTLLAFHPIAKAGLTVESGWDLLVTESSNTVFLGTNWQGVPLGQYGFGGAIGTQYVGRADTIIRRPQAATVSAYGQSTNVPIEIVALQLKSVAPLEPYGVCCYVTLNGSSTGMVTINFDHEPGLPPHGWFTNEFIVNWGLHQGSLDGPLVASGTEGFYLSPMGRWNHTKTPPLGGVPLVQGVNYLLNGTNTDADFHLAFDPNAQPGDPGGPRGGNSGGCESPWYEHLVQHGYDPAKHGITECGVQTNPPPILSFEMTFTNQSVTFSWPEPYRGWTLEVLTNSLTHGLSTNWFTVPGSITTNQMTTPINRANDTVFYRLAY